MISVQLPWHSVPQYAVVVLPQGMRYVVDPRMMHSAVTLYAPGTDRYAVASVMPGELVTVLLPELPDALHCLSEHFQIEGIDQ